MKDFRALSLLCAVFALSLGGRANAAPDGDQLFKSGDFAAAESAYRAALQRNPNDIAANLGLARIELYGNHLDAALQHAQIIKKLDPNNAFADRISAEANARRAIAQGAATPSVPPEGITIPFIASDPLPLMQMTINGHSANVVLDTGAPDITVDPDFAKELRLATHAAGIGHFAGNRTLQMQATTIDSLSAGGLSIHNVAASVVPSRGLPFFGARQVDAIVGTIFLSRFLSTIDYPNARLLLRPRSQTASTAAAEVVPFWWVGDHFLFARGTVNNGPQSLFMVDSGLAGGGFMPEESIIGPQHIKTFPDKAGEGMGAAGPVKVIPVVAARLCLGAACRNDVPGMYSPGGSPLQIFPFSASGMISHEFLKHFAVTVDFNAMHFVLTPPAGASD